LKKLPDVTKSELGPIQTF